MSLIIAFYNKLFLSEPAAGQASFHHLLNHFDSKTIGNKTEISIILPVIVLIYYPNK